MTTKRVKESIKRIVLSVPDDFHHHFRDSFNQKDGRLELVAPLAAYQFGRCIAMPNLVPPITTCSFFVSICIYIYNFFIMK